VIDYSRDTVFCPGWIVDKFKSALGVLEVAQTIVHKADKPKSLFNLLTLAFIPMTSPSLSDRPDTDGQS
jgi:hypothetical protein